MQGKTIDRALCGTWSVDTQDLKAVRELGLVQLLFSEDGNLIYTIHESDGDKIILLTWIRDGDYIITDQPSKRQINRSKYKINGAGKLEIEFGGEKYYFVRGSLQG